MIQSCPNCGERLVEQGNRQICPGCDFFILTINVGIGLTVRQRECLTFIRGHMIEHGRAPRYREIAVALRYVSRGTAHDVVGRLVERGWLRRRDDFGRPRITLAIPERAA